MDVDIASPGHKANPYPFYARLRAESPVQRVTLPDRQTAWLITRYDDVAAVLKDERFVKNKAAALTAEQAARHPWVPGMFRPLERNMLDLDPPDHTRLRALVHRAFTPRLVEAMRGRIESLADELLATAGRRGSMDLIRDYALPIPTTIIAEMLGVPDADRHRFHRWSRSIVSATPSGWGMVRAIPSAIAFLRYIRRLLASRRDQPRDDLVTRHEATASGRGPKELRAIRRASPGRSSSTRHPERDGALAPAERPPRAFLKPESTAVVELVTTPPTGATSRRRPPRGGLPDTSASGRGASLPWCKPRKRASI